jgi:spore germination protein GerM
MKKLTINPSSCGKKVIGILASTLAIVSLTACGSQTAPPASSDKPAQNALPSPKQSPSPTAAAPNAAKPQAATPPANTPQTTAEVYWLKDTGTELAIVPTPTQVAAASAQPDAILKASFEKLLAQPTDSKLISTIPTGTKLRSISVKADGVHLDLSAEFAEGSGSATVIGRLAQAIYTATSLDPQAPVFISVEGKPLTSMSGEGLEVPQPITRQQFEENFDL